jgi:hypothetical protein
MGNPEKIALRTLRNVTEALDYQQVISDWWVVS